MPFIKVTTKWVSSNKALSYTDEVWININSISIIKKYSSEKTQITLTNSYDVIITEESIQEILNRIEKLKE